MKDEYHYILGIYKNSKLASYPKFARYLIFITAILFISAPSSYESYIYLWLQIFAENALILLSVFVFSISPLISYIRRENNLIYKIIAWAPNFLTVLPFLLFMTSGGSWGSHKHPIIHALISNFKIPHEIFFYLPILFTPSYIYVFFSKIIKRSEVVFSLIIYLLSYIIMYGFAIALSPLASISRGWALNA